jgi:hypothetical protein
MSNLSANVFLFSPASVFLLHVITRHSITDIHCGVFSLELPANTRRVDKKRGRIAYE